MICLIFVSLSVYDIIARGNIINISQFDLNVAFDKSIKIPLLNKYDSVCLYVCILLTA